jgi:hypothetical protein
MTNDSRNTSINKKFVSLILKKIQGTVVYEKTSMKIAHFIEVFHFI